MNFQKTLVVLSATALIAFLSLESCKHEATVVPAPIPSEDTTSTQKCDPDSVYFENQIAPLISSSCAYAGCHDAATGQDGVVLDNYRNIITTGEITLGDPSESKLYKVMTSTDPNKVMPPPPNTKLSTDQLALISAWISQGAKNNKCDDCDSSNVTYGVQVTAIMNNCVSCHNASNPSGNIRLDNYTNVKTQVDNGKLKGSIENTAGFSPMPQGGKISDCNIAIINKWISEGALNN
jgi:mono/diheme cytochrome c family protein